MLYQAHYILLTVLGCDPVVVNSFTWIGTIFLRRETNIPSFGYS